MKKNPLTLITGIAGQDGSYLVDHLVARGHQIHGLLRSDLLGDDLEPSESFINSPVTTPYPWRLLGHKDHITLHDLPLEKGPQLELLIQKLRPDYCYHLAAKSFVSYDLQEEEEVMKINVEGTHRLLQALLRYSPHTKVFFAGSSEMFGQTHTSPQNEMTCFRPRSVYGLSKVAGHQLTSYYRQHHGLFACTGILYNHESPRRGGQFVTKKIVQSVAKIFRGEQQELRLGDLLARRDWGHAKDYTRAMILMLEASSPEDFVIGSGMARSVEELVNLAFSFVGLKAQDYIVIDPTFIRPGPPVQLLADAQKAKNLLSWQAEISFEELVHEMMTFEMQANKKS